METGRWSSSTSRPRNLVSDTSEPQMSRRITSVSEAQHRLASAIQEKHATIIGPEHWPAALGYAPWVEEVWMNYLSNAIKYGGTPPRIEIGATPGSDNRVRFWISDNGKGLTAAQQARLFVPFTRLEQGERVMAWG